MYLLTPLSTKSTYVHRESSRVRYQQIKLHNHLFLFYFIKSQLLVNNKCFN
jgi:hypothetical protein